MIEIVFIISMMVVAGSLIWRFILKPSKDTTATITSDFEEVEIETDEKPENQ